MEQIHQGRGRAWLELSRCSNLPTVWSNVLHGLAAGLYVELAQLGGPGGYERMPVGVGFYFNQGFMLLVGMSLVYTAGMVLNDVCDAGDDALHRPARPIPSGRVSRRSAGVAGVVLLMFGVAATTVYRSQAVWVMSAVLAGCVVAYNLLHRVQLLGYLLMPVCRALVLVIAALAFGFAGGEAWTWHVVLPAVVLAVYTALITLTAWAEHTGNARRKQLIVTGMIAAMPLLDAAFLGWIGQWPLAGVCVSLSVLTFVLQRVVPGT